jgi:hypothetical protein
MREKEKKRKTNHGLSQECKKWFNNKVLWGDSNL